MYIFKARDRGGSIDSAPPSICLLPSSLITYYYNYTRMRLIGCIIWGGRWAGFQFFSIGYLVPHPSFDSLAGPGRPPAFWSTWMAGRAAALVGRAPRACY